MCRLIGIRSNEGAGSLDHKTGASVFGMAFSWTIA